MNTTNDQMEKIGQGQAFKFVSHNNLNAKIEDNRIIWKFQRAKVVILA